MAALTGAFPQDPAGMIVTRCMMPLGAAKKAYMGGTAVTSTTAPTAGYCIPASVVTGQIIRGRFLSSVDNTAGANGALSVEVELLKPVYLLRRNNSVSNPCTVALRGTICYSEDDNSVGIVAGSNSAAGRIWDVASDGSVLVELV